jgi:hypothetical protein
VRIAVRPKACPSCQPAYGPLIMHDPRPGRPPAKPAPPALRYNKTAVTHPQYLVTLKREKRQFRAT